MHLVLVPFRIQFDIKGTRPDAFALRFSAANTVQLTQQVDGRGSVAMESAVLPAGAKYEPCLFFGFVK